MKELNKLIKICKDFKNNYIEIEEFQRKVELVVLPDKYKKTLEKEQHNACNRLEEIMFCYKESQKMYSYKVADDLINAVLIEKEKLKKER